ncbi:MAG: DUF192 domain-containing protein [Spirochaetaceae bacterium]|jgi:uncharacterized membrane protein (UPF0127 family)|nr:DUF192 domain-containing protein [Spirochaetaceae bacterium]
MRHWTVLFLLVSLLSCKVDDRVDLTIQGNLFHVEIADEQAEWTQGLMFRKELGQDEGMLFIFPEESYKSFWMKNTLIPLSIAYMDKQGVIVDLLDMTPLDESGIPSSKPAMYALEVNRGRFQNLGREVGQRMILPEEYLLNE